MTHADIDTLEILYGTVYSLLDRMGNATRILLSNGVKFRDLVGYIHPGDFAYLRRLEFKYREFSSGIAFANIVLASDTWKSNGILLIENNLVTPGRIYICSAQYQPHISMILMSEIVELYIPNIDNSPSLSQESNITGREPRLGGSKKRLQ